MESFTFTPILANALSFAFEKATTEGKVTIGLLIIVSLFSWTVIITKARQLLLASAASKKFFAAYRGNRDPLAIYKCFGGALEVLEFLRSLFGVEKRALEFTPDGGVAVPIEVCDRPRKVPRPEIGIPPVRLRTNPVGVPEIQL